MNTPTYQRSETTDWRETVRRELREELAANLCCWTTKKGTRCRGLMRTAALGETREKLAALEEHFTVDLLESTLKEIAPLALCKRSHIGHADSLSGIWLKSAENHRREATRLRRARRGAADGSLASHNARGVARDNGSPRYLTVDDLRSSQVPWEVSPGQPLAILRVREEGGECKLQSFGPSAHREDLEDCPICLNQLQEGPSENRYVQCVACSRSSHLECVERWLHSRESRASLFCPFCRRDTFQIFSYDPSLGRSTPEIIMRDAPPDVSSLGPQARQRTPLDPSSTPAAHTLNTRAHSSGETRETSQLGISSDQARLQRSDRNRRPPSRFQPQ
ncbi:hypothetical protein N7476_005023 [Penicillium atrosanguineum]|uniref:RING-type domain-containing protein n=1 Tax=Penicillium atrosanguineum TaxID=1132637 RepID=A0A9W9PYL9_9EURO|nr:hypothetical protein N7476_005023 [Penicillium atrosanguineum]